MTQLSSLRSAAAEPVALRDVLSALGVPAVAVEPDGTCLAANPAGEALLDVLPPHDSVFAALNAEEPRGFDGEASGQIVVEKSCFAWRMLPLRGSSAQANLITFVDQTENRALSERLVHLDRLATLGRTTASLVHELNGPLSRLATSVEMLASRGPQDRRYLLAEVLRSGRRARDLARQILAFARPHAAPRGIHRAHNVVASAVDLVRANLREQRVELILDRGNEGVSIEGDAVKLRQVVVNLLNNAGQALRGTKGRRIVQVSTRARDQWVRIEVRDNGPGMSRQTRERLFDPFFTTKSTDEGTGLGLHIAQRIVQEHGGRIHVQSELSAGSRFVVELPGSTQSAPGTAEEWPPGQLQTGQTGRVLVVDDDQVLVRLLQDILDEAGYSVVTASSGEQALSLIDTGEFDIIMSDMRMPGMDGQGLYYRIKERDPALARRIIFITGDVISRETARFFAEAGTPHLAKPFRIDELSASLKMLHQQVAERKPGPRT